MIVFFLHHLHFPTETAGVYPQYLLVICVNSPALSKTEVSLKNLEGEALWGAKCSVLQHRNSDLFRKACWRSQESRSYQLPVLGIQNTKKSQFILKLNSRTNQGFISSPAALPTPGGTEHGDIVDVFLLCCCLIFWPTAPKLGTS